MLAKLKWKTWSVVQKFLNFYVANKSLKSSKTYQRFQLSLLHGEIHQSKFNEFQGKEFDFLHYALQTETSLTDFTHVHSLFLGFWSIKLPFNKKFNQADHLVKSNYFTEIFRALGFFL